MPGLIRSFKGLIRPRGVSLNANSISIEESSTYQLIATITPSNTKNNKITWTSSDNSVATVSDAGLVTAVSEGNCVITVKTEDRGFIQECECEVWVISITGFELNKNSTTINYLSSEQLTLTITPSDATYQGVTWASSDTSICTVTQAGLVSAVGEGDCIITCTSEDGVHSANCAVTVEWIRVTGVTLNTNSFTGTVGNTYQLTATIAPEDAAIKDVNWTSSDTSIATVSSAGVVTIKKTGSVTITVTTVDGGYIAQCVITCNVILNLLLVGGGGAGGRARCRAGGGGGAGGLLYCTNFSVLNGSYAVAIGAGGTACAAQYVGACGNGCNSTALGLTAYGGGGGGGMYTYKCGRVGAAGGSGGGGSGCGNDGGAGCSGQGNSGGAGYLTRGGGGGGAGGAGYGASTGGSYYGGAGGNGCCLNIAGAYYWYSAGGGGGGCTGISLSCGGGCGGNYRVAGYAATCYGSGGGGAGCTASSSCCIAGGNGYQGVFIISYPSGCGYTITGGTKYLCNGRCVHCFTEDGTLVVN